LYTADYFISEFRLESHVEGGYFKEVYRSSIEISGGEIFDSFEGKRNLSTTIYFLLKSGQVSKFHRLKSDEIWFYHYGCPMIIHTIDDKGEYQAFRLGINPGKKEKPQVQIPSGFIFGAEPAENNSFSLVSCMVSPGFDFRDFIMFDEKQLALMYPQHGEIISRLSGTR
jgi:predicted cupin superfamily sugar epimerase